MKFGLDEYNYLDSPLHRWDPRLKLIGLLVLIFAFAFVQDFRVLLAMVVITAAIYVISDLPLSFLLTRLRYPSFFLLVVVILLPFLSGENVVASVGPFDLREEGITSALMIAARFLSILTIGLVLFGTAPFLTTIEAMRALKLPAIITDMALLAFRYIYDIADYLHRMKIAMRLRGFHERRFGFQGLKILSWLGGSILVRSYERSEWVYKAMILRGYGQATPVKYDFKPRRADAIALGLALLTAVTFIALEVVI